MCSENDHVWDTIRPLKHPWSSSGLYRLTPSYGREENKEWLPPLTLLGQLSCCYEASGTSRILAENANAIGAALEEVGDRLGL